MQKSELFFHALGLQNSHLNKDVSKKRHLTIKINLKARPVRGTIPWTPKTPCSMLSPLTPKIQNKCFDWYSNFQTGLGCDEGNADKTPVKDENNQLCELEESTLSLVTIDVTSPLGRRLTHTLSLLIPAQFRITKDYEEYCKPQPVKEQGRRLRSLQGREAPIYKKRYRHRHVNRPYMLSHVDRKERSRKLRCGGLNKASRHLLRKMRNCVVKLVRFNPLSPISATEKNNILSYSPYVLLSPLNLSDVAGSMHKVPLKTDVHTNSNGRCEAEVTPPYKGKTSQNSKATKQKKAGSGPDTMTLGSGIQKPASNSGAKSHPGAKVSPKKAMSSPGTKTIQQTGLPTPVSTIKYLRNSRSTGHRKSVRRKVSPRRLLDFI